MSRVVCCIPGLAALLAWTAVAVAEPTVTPREQPAAAAGESQVAIDVREEIARVDVKLKLYDGTPFAGEMVVTHYRPEGSGPFPLVVFSHGRTPTSRHEPARWRALQAARYWTRRGFAVIVPTRVGYGELNTSVDPEISGSCANANFRPAIDAMTTQIARAVDFARTLPWVDGSRIILTGVSYGGFGTIAATSAQIAGVVGAVNFVGGLGGSPQQRPSDPCQGERITGLAAEFGGRSRVPTLWLYADNDAYWGKEWPRRWFDAFTAAGGSGKLVNFAAVGDDGHKLMSSAFPSWRPVVDRFVASIGFKLPMAAPSLQASGFAAIDDADKVPFTKPSARVETWPKFLAADVPRAFAFAPGGAWAWRSGLDAVEVALSRCQQNARTPCKLYAVDDRVVWKQQSR